MGLALALGNFPQLVRDLHPLWQAGDLAALVPPADARPLPASGLTEWAGKAAVDIALMDWVGQRLGIPLYTYFGLDPKDTPLTTFSIGIDTPEITKQKTREAEAFPILKVKVGLDTDEPTIEAVRSVTSKPLALFAIPSTRESSTFPPNVRT